MIKFFFKTLIFISLFAATSAYAGLISTDVTEDSFITRGDLDWAWASTIHLVEYQEEVGATINYLKEADYHAGWRVVSTEKINGVSELDLLRSLTITDFCEYDNGVIDVSTCIQALSFWNTELTAIADIDISDFNNGWIKSKSAADNTFEENEFEWMHETFYVRNTVSQVPEPSSIMIFAIALIALSMRKRAIK